jgi:hypothetical protein
MIRKVIIAFLFYLGSAAGRVPERTNVSGETVPEAGKPDKYIHSFPNRKYRNKNVSGFSSRLDGTRNPTYTSIPAGGRRRSA